jgi:hypothetical protein
MTTVRHWELRTNHRRATCCTDRECRRDRDVIGDHGNGEVGRGLWEEVYRVYSFHVTKEIC